MASATALSLERLASDGPFAAVVSGPKAGMDGITFLSRVQKLAKDTVCIMLSGKVDLASVIDAVNRGQIFRDPYASPAKKESSQEEWTPVSAIIGNEPLEASFSESEWRS